MILGLLVMQGGANGIHGLVLQKQETAVWACGEQQDLPGASEWYLEAQEPRPNQEYQHAQEDPAEGRRLVKLQSLLCRAHFKTDDFNSKTSKEEEQHHHNA